MSNVRKIASDSEPRKTARDLLTALDTRRQLRVQQVVGRHVDDASVIVDDYAPQGAMG